MASLIFALLFAIIFDVPINSLYIFVAIIGAPFLDLLEALFSLDDLSSMNQKPPKKKKTGRWGRIRDKLHLPHTGGLSLRLHERCTHNIFVLFITLGIVYFNMSVGLAAFSAIFSHLFLDLFTVHGCPLLYPLRETRYVALRTRNRLRTGSRQEKALFIFLTIIVFSSLFCYFSLFTIVDGQLRTTDKVTVTASDNNNNTTNVTTYYNRDKSNINLNVYPDKKGEKNITIEYGDQKTNILIEDIDDEK